MCRLLDSLKRLVVVAVVSGSIILPLTSWTAAAPAASGWNPYGHRYAIILASYSGGMDTWYWEETSYMYRNLIKYGFHPDDIRYFATGDSAVKHSDIVDGTGTYANMKAAYEWVASVSTNEDLVVIFWMSHGNTSSALLMNSANIRYSEIGTWTKAITAKMILGGYQPCESGGMVDDLSRAWIITATSTDASTLNSFPWSYNWPLAFDGYPADLKYKNMNHQLVNSSVRADTDGDSVVSATEAYIWVMKQYNREGAMFDDNGDKQGGQYGKTTFNPDDPSSDGYIGKHFSLLGWKPIGGAVAINPESFSIRSGSTKSVGLRIGSAGAQQLPSRVFSIDGRLLLPKGSSSVLECMRGEIVVLDNAR